MFSVSAAVQADNDKNLARQAKAPADPYSLISFMGDNAADIRCRASHETASEVRNVRAFEDAGSKLMTTEKYICHSMMNSFNMLISRGQNAHREICESSALYFMKCTPCQGQL